MLEKLKHKKQTAYQEIIEWLKEHEGKMPKGAFLEEGKVLKRKDMTEEQLEEVRLYQRWHQCGEKKILDEYAGRPIEEVPEEYREKVSRLRNLMGQEKIVSVYEQIIEWLKEHNGKMPQSGFSEDGKALTRKNMTEDQLEEIRLYQRWYHCQERKILDEYTGIQIEEVPEEFREKIRVLRSYGLGKTPYEEIIKWLEEHEGKMPRGNILNDGKRLKHEDMTEEQVEEENLYHRWNRCQEKKILYEYEERPIEEVPEEYREKIAKLRKLIVQEEKVGVEIEIIKWLKEHKGKMPRGNILINGERLKHGDMTEEQLEEVNLYARWISSTMNEILNKYAEKSIEEVPEEFREKIIVLRSYGLGKTPYEEIIKWLEEHEGKMPRGNISKDGKSLTHQEMTGEERKEKNLYARWFRCRERKILDEYAGRPIEEVPEEYREKIARLRELGQLGTKKDDKIKNRMKAAVASRVKDNKEVRQELEEEKEIELNESDGIEPFN